jgi:hypothetical protein
MQRNRETNSYVKGWPDLPVAVTSCSALLHACKNELPL